MPLTKPELWKLIEAYEIGSFGAPSAFADRLAQENGWEAGYASAVIREYKRFIYAICVSGEVLSPSPDIDKAWHLHLVHTKDYWRHFCRVLGQEIHHQPAGGDEDSDTHRRNKVRAMEILTAEFDESPPASIWSFGNWKRLESPLAAGAPDVLTLPRGLTFAVFGILALFLCNFLIWVHGFVPFFFAFALFLFPSIFVLTHFKMRQTRDKGGCAAGCGGDGDGGGCGGGD